MVLLVRMTVTLEAAGGDLACLLVIQLARLLDSETLV